MSFTKQKFEISIKKFKLKILMTSITLRGITMSFEIIFIPAMIIMGVELRTTYINNECFRAIPAFWETLKKENPFTKIPYKADSDALLAVYTNYTPDFSLKSGYYSMIVGCPVTKVDSIPAGMVVKEIPAQKYAVFTAKGPFVTALGKTWTEIWQNQDLQRTFTADFEKYDVQSTNDENSIVKIYVAVK
jgi:predicted transcriptional regulator YdeE